MRLSVFTTALKEISGYDVVNLVHALQAQTTIRIYSTASEAPGVASPACDPLMEDTNGVRQQPSHSHAKQGEIVSDYYSCPLLLL